MNKLTEKDIRALMFWAEFGAEHARAGQYQTVITKLLNPRWGNKIPIHIDAYLADKKIKDLEQQVETLSDSRTAQGNRIVILEEVAKEYRKHMRIHDPLWELVTP